MGTDRNNLACGALFGFLGLSFIVYASTTLPIGEASAMGPGYFPIVLGGFLFILGVVIGMGGQHEQATALPPISWRGVILITGAALFFGMTVRGLGFAPSLLVATFMAAMATGQMRPHRALILAGALTLFNIAIFVIALRLPYPIFGPWFGG